MKRIGLLTSGGDAPGMNAVIYAVIKEANKFGIEVLGIQQGYRGLIEHKVKILKEKDIRGIYSKGGTILETSRSKEFKTPEGFKKAVQTIWEEELDGLIIIGGEGSLKGAGKLANEGINIMGIPGSIDNDIKGTDYSIGFMTACNIVTEAIDNINDTAMSLNSDEPRIFTIEAMGRRDGWISLLSGIASEVDLIAIPEVDVSIPTLVNEIQGIIKNKSYCLVLVAEGVQEDMDIAKEIEKEIGYKVRHTLLGFIQRGGAPCVFDRILAKSMGIVAVRNLNNETGSKLITIRENKIESINFNEKDNYETHLNDYFSLFGDKIVGY